MRIRVNVGQQQPFQYRGLRLRFPRNPVRDIRSHGFENRGYERVAKEHRRKQIRSSPVILFAYPQWLVLYGEASGNIPVCKLAVKKSEDLDAKTRKKRVKKGNRG